MIDTRSRELLEDMRRFAGVSRDLAGDKSPAEIEADLTVYLALCHAVQIVGEAASKLDVSVRGLMTATPWRDIVKTRNIIVHGYAHVDVGILTTIAQRDMPLLIAEIDTILAAPAP